MTEKASQVTELTKERSQLVAQINELKTAVENYKFKARSYWKLKDIVGNNNWDYVSV